MKTAKTKDQDQVHFSRDQVMGVISSLMHKVGESNAQPMHKVYVELQKLTQILSDMHAEIAATPTQDIGQKHVPIATDELDAVVGVTEEASATIMDATEAIQAIVSDHEDIQGAVMAETTKIFEACTFQDITGQRITKVIKTLKDIEAIVARLHALFDPDGKRPVSMGEDTRTEDEKLMNGPQLEGQGVTQDEIDKLLAEFG